MWWIRTISTLLPIRKYLSLFQCLYSHERYVKFQMNTMKNQNDYVFISINILSSFHYNCKIWNLWIGQKKVLILNAPVETKMQTIWFCVRSQLWVLRSVSICLSSIYHTAWRNLVVSIFFIGFSHPFFAMKHRVVHFVSFPFYKRIEYLNMEHW